MGTPHTEELTDPDDAPSPWLLPVWFEAGLIVAVAGLVCVGGAGLALAVLGRYGLVPALLWGALGTVLTAGLALFRLHRHRDGRSAHLPSAAMLVVAAVSAAVNGRAAGHYVLVDREPGVYAVAGRWLAGHGTLQVPGGTPWAAVASTSDPGSIGVDAVPGGLLQFQFDHFLPVVLAVARGLGGDRAMFAANAVLGAIALLAVYAVGVRVCRRPWLVVAAVTALGMTLPQLQFTRDTYSEPVTQLLLWSGLWLLLTSWERRHLGLAALGGLTLGATLMARSDATLLFVALPAAAGVAVAVARTRGQGRSAVTWLAVAVAAALPPAALAAVDLARRSTVTYAGQRPQILVAAAVLVVAAVVGLVIALAGPLAAVRRVAMRLRAPVGAGAGVVVVAVLLVVWGLRPALQQLKGAADATTAALQAVEGVPAAPGLTYSEYALTWFTWYLGPVAVVLGVVGLGLLTRAAVRGAPAALLVLVTAGPLTARYLYAVSNTPEQVLAMRRYVVAALPLFALAAVVAIEALAVVLLRLPAARASWARAALAVGAVALLAFPLGRLRPVHEFETQAGYLPAIDTVCTTIGPDAAVVFAPDDPAAGELAQTMRSFCDVPATRFIAPPSTAELATYVDTARAQGRTLWVLGSSEAAAQSAVGGAVTARQLADTTNPRLLEVTLTRPPEEYDTERLTLWGARVG